MELPGKKAETFFFPNIIIITINTIIITVFTDGDDGKKAKTFFYPTIIIIIRDAVKNYLVDFAR